MFQMSPGKQRSMLRKLLRKYPFELYIIRFYIVWGDISLCRRHKQQSGEGIQSLSVMLHYYVTLLQHVSA